MDDFNLTVLGMKIAFRAGADAERVKQAKELVEERFEKLRSHGGQSSKELLLVFLVLGLADDLLQSRRQLSDVQERVEGLLRSIEETA